MIFWNVDYLPSVRTADSKRHAVKHKNKAILVTLKLQDKQKKYENRLAYWLLAIWLFSD